MPSAKIPPTLVGQYTVVVLPLFGEGNLRMSEESISPRPFTSQQCVSVRVYAKVFHVKEIGAMEACMYVVGSGRAPAN